MDLDLLLCDLEDPWKSRARALLHGVGDGPALRWEHYTILAGTYWHQVHDLFEVTLTHFVAGQGFAEEKRSETSRCAQAFTEFDGRRPLCMCRIFLDSG